MKVSQELKDEFEKLKEEQSNKSIYRAFATITHAKYVEYETLREFLFTSRDYLELNANQLQFAKWWAGEEEIEVEEELYYLKLPFSRSAYVNLDTNTGEVFPQNKDETKSVRTKFTMSEIENNEKLRAFEMFKKRVDDDV